MFVFACRNIEGTYYMRKDYRTQCYDEGDFADVTAVSLRALSLPVATEWTLYACISAIFIVVWIAGIPLAYFILCARNRC